LMPMEAVATCNDPELQLERILSHLSYLRINIDEIVLPEENPLIERLFNEGSLYGFNLEYQFPCLENISRSLKTPIQIPAKSFTMTSIQFRHKRVVLLQITPNTVPLWNQHRLVIRLRIQLNTQGKFSTRLLGYCVVPLAELLIPPFMICRDFNFVAAKGMKFEGSSLVRGGIIYVLQILYVTILFALILEVGKKNLVLKYAPSDGIATKDKAVPFRERASSNLTDLSDSVFDDHDTRNLAEPMPRREFRPAVRSDTSSSVRERERASPASKCLIQLTVHEGRGLPLVQDERNRYVSPNSFISVLGRDGELRSTVCERSRRPLWDWTARFHICGERRNVIVKVFHHDINGDKTLGFVSISLPIEDAHRVDYEMVDLTGTANINGEVPIITVNFFVFDIFSFNFTE
uniref:C2 domain-containing protein n=1 Tax=Angiostrongylus cantonensis TaxID=6313 RepID=A0A0K0DLF4_ANGCA